MNIIFTLIVHLGAVGACISLLGLFSAHHYLFDLIAQFQVQYIALIVVPLLLALVVKKYISLLVLMFCMAVHLASVSQVMLVSENDAVDGGLSLRIMSSNVKTSNTKYTEYSDYIKSVRPDIVMFLEFSESWRTQMRAQLPEYQYKIELPREDNFGVAIYSKLPLKNGKVTDISERFPSIESEVIVGDKVIRVLAAHPPPPMSENLYRIRNDQLSAISDWVREENAPAVVAGDLNVSIWSSHYKRFIKNAGLSHGRKGFSYLPTWPTYLPPLSIPIDHILVSSHFSIAEMGVSSGLNSDHKALWAEIQIRESSF